MILARGELYDTGAQDQILQGLEAEIDQTRRTQTLPAETVIRAIGRLRDALADGLFDRQLDALELDGVEQYKRMALLLLSRENIEYKLRVELGADFFKPRRTAPPHGQPSIRTQAMPLGTLLHIAAGNVDGLPAFSLAEGLLTGNVNILKLPQADNGLSLEIIQTLLEIEPALRDFVYVFDTPSSDLAAMQRMAAVADGIVVWGGDAAVAAARRLAPLGARLIEWGHKLGFAYISGYEDEPAELAALAEHIASTRQLLCSSCQTIFLDTARMEDLHAFCDKFLPVLERAVRRHAPTSLGGRAETTLRRYYDTLAQILGGAPEAGMFRGDGCSLTACEDSALALSGLAGNCLVKRLPREQIFSLRRQKGYLQTAGLLCTPERRETLTQLLARCGVTRITRAGNMSAMFSGEAHDGDYPLRRYVRMVDIE